MAKEQLFRSYLSSALFVIQQYTGNSPFSLFLKEFFAANKKYGSRDRKYITSLCYCYFRCGHALKTAEPEKKMLTGLFLCSTEANELLQQLHPGWNEKADLSLENKIALLEPEFVPRDIFPWQDELGESIDFPAFCISHLVQPSVFLRIRPGYRSAVLAKLQAHAVSYEEINEQCLALANASRLDAVLDINKEIVVQDFNSQNTGEFLNAFPGILTGTVWDCCAASGGKSIMAYDINPDIELTVSDIRENILANLRKRFAAAGIMKFRSFVTDLTIRDGREPQERYHLIIADIPCSGSGTWSRNPEQLCFFDKKEINKYAALQKKILSRVTPSLQTGGHLLYITCSVFKKENEETVAWLQEKLDLQLIKMEYLTGYDRKADSLFAALFKKQL